MDSRQFKRVKALYRFTADLSEVEREEILQALCPDDAEVRKHVHRLAARTLDETRLDELIRDLAQMLESDRG